MNTRIFKSNKVVNSLVSFTSVIGLFIVTAILHSNGHDGFALVSGGIGVGIGLVFIFAKKVG
jgi:hypothetical protein